MIYCTRYNVSDLGKAPELFLHKLIISRFLLLHRKTIIVAGHTLNLLGNITYYKAVELNGVRRFHKAAANFVNHVHVGLIFVQYIIYYS